MSAGRTSWTRISGAEHSSARKPGSEELGSVVSRRTATGWTDLPSGEVVAFPRGERGAHGYENRSATPVRLLMISEMTGPSISVYPDANQVGIFDAGQPQDRRFGALFDVDTAISDYGGGKARLVPPAPRES
jgi:hypothetical protein